MKKLLILSLAIFCFYGCKSTQSGVATVPPKTSPIVTFKDFVDQSKCEFVAEDNLNFHKIKLHAFILHIKDIENISSEYISECISEFNGTNENNLKSWGFRRTTGSYAPIFYRPVDNGLQISISDKSISKDKITVVVVVNIKGKEVVDDQNNYFSTKDPNRVLTSANEEFDLTKIDGISFMFKSFVPTQVNTGRLKWTEGLLPYSKRSSYK